MSKELTDLCNDMLVAIENLKLDLEAVAAHEVHPRGWKTAAQAARRRTRILGKMGLEFRKLSYKIEQETREPRKKKQ